MIAVGSIQVQVQLDAEPGIPGIHATAKHYREVYKRWPEYVVDQDDNEHGVDGACEGCGVVLLEGDFRSVDPEEALYFCQECSRTVTLREVCFIIGATGEVLWRDTNDNPGYLNDRRDRWEAIWEHRKELTIIAHSHPMGPATFSSEDLSTMKAIHQALGTAPYFAVTSPGGTFCWNGHDSFQQLILPIYLEPAWARDLRIESNMALTCDVCKTDHNINEEK
jgi:proteasome lid subunit RPN8/RPN11